MSIYSLSYYHENEVPIGTVIPYASDFLPNSMYLLCDGAPFDTVKYSLLSSILMSSNTPDFRGCTMYGTGAGIFNAMSGTIVQQVTNSFEITDEFMPSHNHMGGKEALLTNEEAAHSHGTGRTNTAGSSHTHTIQHAVEPVHDHGTLDFNLHLSGNFHYNPGSETQGISPNWNNTVGGYVYTEMSKGGHDHTLTAASSSHSHTTSLSSAHTHTVTYGASGGGKQVDIPGFIPSAYIVNFIIKALHKAS